MNALEFLSRIESYGDRIAMRTSDGSYTYSDLLHRSHSIATALLDGAEDLREARVAIWVAAGPMYVSSQWGVWQAGGVVLPISLSATESELEYALVDADVSILITSSQDANRVEHLCRKFSLRILIADADVQGSDQLLPKMTSQRRAMILYTSGTTSRPKGVVTTHANIQAQIESLVKAWEWSEKDRIPLFLPLHHIHGIINVLCCSLWSGAWVDVFPRFDAKRLLERVSDGDYSLFMAVPTIYVKLIEALESEAEPLRNRSIEGFRQMRLMVSGSAALPSTVHAHWYSLTNQSLLERYGMTEIGMALSNPYRGDRRPGTVGLPLPHVEVRLKSEQGKIVASENEVGEIQVRGPGVFREYWNRAAVTESSFEDGWFKTGDIAVVEGGYYRILGRQSVDIIKSGGYKLSALEIESVLLDHEQIQECAVVGLEDPTWGEVVSAAIVLKKGELTLECLRQWCRDRLSHYKIPQRLRIVEGLPRNALGKVTKPVVKTLFDPQSEEVP